MTKMKKYISKTVNQKKKVVNVNAIYRSKRPGAAFNIKDKIKLQHQHNVVYHAQCPNKKCKSEYTGKTKCRIEKRGDQHKGKDKQSNSNTHKKQNTRK